jgi:hypothetical protein
VHEASGGAEHQDLVRLERLGDRLVRESRHHLVDVGLAGDVRIGAAAATRVLLRSARRRCRRELGVDLVEAVANLCRGQRAGAGGIPLGEPLVERAGELVARDGAVLVGVDRREERGRDAAAAAEPATAAGCLWRGLSGEMDQTACQQCGSAGRCQRRT